MLHFMFWFAVLCLERWWFCCSQNDTCIPLVILTQNSRGLCNLFLEMITISIAHIFPLKDYWFDHKDEENSPSFFVCIVTWQHFVQFLKVAGSFDRTINWLELDHKYISHVSFYRGINHNMYFFLKKYRRKYSGYVSTRIRQY